MQEKTIVFLVAGAFLFVALAGLLYSLLLQKKGIGTQDSTVSKVDESLALSREALALQKEALKLAGETLELQREANRLLGAIAREKHT
jgi:hypothetical protein